MGGHPGPKTYMGWWGNLGGAPQKGIITYGVSANAQKPFKGALHSAIFNTFRRVKAQALYVAIPVAVYWYVWTSARDYNEFLYTKAGREELARVNV